MLSHSPAECEAFLSPRRSFTTGQSPRAPISRETCYRTRSRLRASLFFFSFSRAGFLEGRRAAEIRHGSCPRRDRDKSLRTVLRPVSLPAALQAGPSLTFSFALRHEPGFLCFLASLETFLSFFRPSPYFARGSFSTDATGQAALRAEHPFSREVILNKGRDFVQRFQSVVDFFGMRCF